LKINYKDYKNYLNNSDITDVNVIFVLKIKKDVRNISKNFVLFLRKNQIIDIENKENNKENYQEIKKNLDFFIKII